MLDIKVGDWIWWELHQLRISHRRVKGSFRVREIRPGNVSSQTILVYRKRARPPQQHYVVIEHQTGTITGVGLILPRQ